MLRDEPATVPPADWRQATLDIAGERAAAADPPPCQPGMEAAIRSVSPWRAFLAGLRAGACSQRF